MAVNGALQLRPVAGLRNSFDHLERYAMSEGNPQAADQQRRYREFLDLLPLTLTLAGLPNSEQGKYYTEEQIELRANTLQRAYKMARSLARDVIAR